MEITWFSSSLTRLFYGSQDILDFLAQLLTGEGGDLKQALNNKPRKDLENLRNMANAKCSACMIEDLKRALDEVLASVAESTSIKVTTEELYFSCLAGVSDEKERKFIETVVEVFRKGDLLTSSWKPEDVGLYFLDLLGYVPKVLKPNRVLTKMKKLLFKASKSFESEEDPFNILAVYKLVGFLVKNGVVKKGRGNIVELIIGFESYIAYSRNRTNLLDSRRAALSRVTNLSTISANGKRPIDGKAQHGFDAEMVDWVVKCCRRFGYNPEFDIVKPESGFILDEVS
jgi:hypothetical protein